MNTQEKFMYTCMLYNNGYNSIIQDTKKTKQNKTLETKCPSVADQWIEQTTTRCENTDEFHDISKTNKQKNMCSIYKVPNKQN